MVANLTTSPTSPARLAPRLRITLRPAGQGFVIGLVDRQRAVDARPCRSAVDALAMTQAWMKRGHRPAFPFADLAAAAEHERAALIDRIMTAPIAR
jgi:hypothetical protein